MSSAANFLNPVTRSYLDKLQSDRLAYCDRVQQLREYDIGEVTLNISDKEKAKLGDDKITFNINVVQKVNKTVRNRLTVQNISVTIPADDANTDAAKERGEQLTNIARQWWRKSRMDRFQKDLHYAASRDGDGYIVVEFDNEYRCPMFYVNWAFDGENGVDMHYLEGNPLKPLRATKRWDEGQNADGTRLRRMNIYEENRVLKLINARASEGDNADWGWEPYDEDGTLEIIDVEIAGDKFKAGVAWWTVDGTENGEPLGIPVFHFANDSTGDAYGRATADAVVPDLQDAVNQANAAYVIASRLSGFGRGYVTGFYDSEVTLEMGPGDFLNLEDPNAKVGSVPADNIEQLGQVVDRELGYCSFVTGVPFNSIMKATAQIKAEGTLQQEEGDLLELIENNQVVFGNAYEDMIRMAFLLDSVFNEQTEHGLDSAAIEELEFDTQWKDAQTRSEQSVLEMLKIKAELGVPKEQLFEEMDYEPEKIQQFLAHDQATQLIATQNAQLDNMKFTEQWLRGTALARMQSERNGGSAIPMPMFESGNGVENVRQPEPA